MRYALCLAALFAFSAEAGEMTILNASYDVSREFYQEYDALFVDHWREAHGETVTVHQSHGGSSKQARAVLDGLEADVVTMNQATDVDMLASTVEEVFGSWAEAQHVHFADGGTFDRIYQPGAK